MSSNYQNHQKFELQKKFQTRQEQISQANQSEGEWHRAIQKSNETEFAPKSLSKYVAKRKEHFRKDHLKQVQTAQELGEIQDERFQWCEEEEDWQH